MLSSQINLTVFPYMIRLLKNLIILCVVGSTGLIGIGFLGTIHPALDTAAHFRMHLSLCLLIAFLVLILTRHRKVAILALVAASAGIYTSQVGYPWTNLSKDKLLGKPEYSLLHLNLLWNHDDPPSVVNWLHQQDADILSLSELSHYWEPHMVRLHKTWPHIFHCPEFGKRGGVRIYSKWPIDHQKDYCGVYGTFGKTTVSAPSGETLTIGSLHLRWPWPASGPEQLETFIPELEAMQNDVLIAGDFNATPWSNTVTRFAKAGNLQIAPGIGPTWLFRELPGWLAGIIGLPIDHVLHKGNFHIVSVKRMEHVNSDHFPVQVKFQILN